MRLTFGRITDAPNVNTMLAGEDIKHGNKKNNANQREDGSR